MMCATFLRCFYPQVTVKCIVNINPFWLYYMRVLILLFNFFFDGGFWTDPKINRLIFNGHQDSQYLLSQCCCKCVFSMSKRRKTLPQSAQLYEPSAPCTSTTCLCRYCFETNCLPHSAHRCTCPSAAAQTYTQQRYLQSSHYILVLKCNDFSRTFKDPEVAFSRTNSRRKFTARTVLEQHVISISVIMGQF